MALDQVDTDQELGYYVYGIVPATTAPPQLSGLDDVAVELIVRDQLAAVVSSLTLERPPGRRAELLAHTRVVDGLAESGPVVPVRFGSVLEHDTAVVEELLADQSQAATAALAHLRGKVQLNLRVTYVEARILQEVVEEDPRIQELRSRTRGLPEGAVHPDLVELGERVARAMESKRVDDADRVMAVLRPHPVEVSERGGGGLEHVLDVALLLPADELDQMLATLEDFAEQTHERLRCRLVGPVAPYDFAQEVAWD